MDITPEMVYKTYCTAVAPLDNIFGKDNWVVNNFTDQAIIYCAYFNIKMPSGFNFKLSKDTVNILFKDNDGFNKYLEKYPKVDKTKVIDIVISNNDIKITIHAFLWNEFNMEQFVKLNNLYVRKINLNLNNLENRIREAIAKKNQLDFVFYNKMFACFFEINQKISKSKENKEANKKQLLDAIKRIDEMYSKEILMSDEDLARLKDNVMKVFPTFNEENNGEPSAKRTMESNMETN